MFDHIFENRDKKVTNIVKLSDYLGRSLRENVEVFSIDDTDGRVTFITESGNIIAGNYDFENGIKLNNIQIEDGELFENNESFDEFVDYKISNFIQNIFEEDLVDADTSFNKVLQLWESRVKFSSVKKKLYEKSQKFNGTNRILESTEFQKMVEIAPQIVEFLKQSPNLINIPEIKNMVRLSSSVSEAFDLPRISADSLSEETYEISDQIHHSIYEMICKQELIRKELVESKNNFDLVWLNNQKVANLAGLLYEKEEEVVAKALVEAICEVPYLALATKRQIMETITNNLELNDNVRINLKDIKSFSSMLFEYKKPLKGLFISMLNEKYGISVQNLKDIPTFKSLLNTQVLIFEALAKLSPKGTVLKETLSEASKMLKTKNGVESIDVNQFIELLFEKAGYADILDQQPISEVISLKETFSEIDSIDELIELVLDRLDEAEAPKGASSEPEHHASTRRANMTADEITAKKALEKVKKQKAVDAARKERQDSETELDDDPKVDENKEKGYPEKGIKGGTKAAEEEAEKRDDEADDEGKKKKKLSPKQKKELDVEPPPDGDGDIDAKDLAMKRAERKDEDEEDDSSTAEVPTSSEIMQSFKSFEDILNSINFEDIVRDEQEDSSEEEAASDEETE
jgi:hypothetical protein